jgi:tetraacyldisaccharide 4'-kinase
MKTSLPAYWRGMASGKRNDLLARLVLALLVPPSLAYSLLQRLRVWLYRAGVLNTKRLPRPVISIGNISVGGTGKTPVTAYIARLLLNQGLRVVVLSRGYGGTCEGQMLVVSDGNEIFLSANECGDEPFLLARTIPGLKVVIGTDRHAAGLLAMERLNPEIFLLDDGFQHLRLHRDLNVLLLDYARPFGNGWTLPAGLLREAKRAAERADLVIHTRCPVDAAARAVINDRPFLTASHRLLEARPLSGAQPVGFDMLRGSRILAFAAIAEPDAFYAGLREQGLTIVQTLSFPDHARYDEVQLAELTDAIRDCRAEYVLTTEKDGVKLKGLPPEISNITMLAQLVIEIHDSTRLSGMVRNLLQKTR